MAKKKKAAAKKTNDFPAVLAELAEKVNGGEATTDDFEMYESFNEQYKPSDWTQNPKADDEFLTFGMDGTGGQVSIWLKNDEAELDAQPVVFLGSEGEVAVLATDLPGFLSLVCAGVDPYRASTGEVDGVEKSDEMFAWLKKHYPKHKTEKPKKVLAAARSAHPGFEEHLESLRGE